MKCKTIRAYYKTSTFSKPLVDFIKEMQDCLNEIPEGCLETASITIDVDHESGHIFPITVVNYRRPLTQEEANLEEQAIKKREELQKVRDLQELARLKQLYPNE